LHISTGDLLREERQKGKSGGGVSFFTKGGADAVQIESFIKEGKLVPSEMLVKLILKVVN